MDHLKVQLRESNTEDTIQVAQSPNWKILE